MALIVRDTHGVQPVAGDERVHQQIMLRFADWFEQSGREARARRQAAKVAHGSGDVRGRVAALITD